MQQAIAVSENTELLLKGKRESDFRIDIIYSLMYDDDMGGIHPNRTIKMMDGDDLNSETSCILRKAGVLDTIRYFKTPESEIKSAIEQNIQSLVKLKENGQGMQGLPPIKDVYLFVYVVDPATENIKVNSYKNPNSQDIGDILRTDKQIIMCGFIVTYPTLFPGQKLPEGYPEEVYEWSFLSPLIESSLPEYKRMSAKFEAEELSKMFFIDFTDSNEYKQLNN